MSTLLVPNTSPALDRVRAIVTTKWGKSGYRPLVIRNLESYYVDTALDSDADTWQVSIGDPYGEFLDMLRRDSEVRIQLFGVGQEATNFLMTGIADEIEYDEEGTISLTGRDLSSLAIDSIVPPKKFAHVRAWAVVDQQARELGFKQTNLTRAPMVRKVQTTDGNETFWEFWYRLYRKEKMFLWTEANGVLSAGRLNSGFGVAPAYYFGKPKIDDDPRVKQRYIPVERCAVRKSTQSRIWEVWVYGQRGDNGFRVISRDPTMNDWMKKPIKILQDTEAHTERSAQKLGWQEIYEGKVGSLEVRLTIPDPGFAVKPNKIAIVRIPEIGFSGDFYVVGARYQGGPDGFVQEIRLRERQFAISRRTPKDPKVPNQIEEPRSKAVIRDVGSQISDTVGGMPETWGAYFVKAAKEFHGPWDYSLFLATLLAIADQETGGAFANIRANGGPGGNHIEWYPWKVARNGPTWGEVASEAFADKTGIGRGYQAPEMGVAIDARGRTRSEYEQIFANMPGRYTSETWAVGPMQLYSSGYKYYADDHLKPGFRNEYEGGRWNPESNIYAGAFALRDKLKLMVGDSGRDIDMWAGVSAYGHHYADETPNTVPTKYAISVKNKVYTDPGYLASTTTAVQTAREAAHATKDGNTDAPPTSDEDIVGTGLPTISEVKQFWSTLGTGFTTPSMKRKAIVMAAMWGYYNREVMHYAGSDTGHQNERLSDFGPPPNVPEWTDCSGFADWCYLSADAPSPGGWTNPQWNGGQNISLAQILAGDLVFYADPNSTSGHVAVYVGFGKIVSFGSEEGPSCPKDGISYRSDVAGFRRYLETS